MFSVIESLPAGRLMSVAEVADRCAADPHTVRQAWIQEGVEIAGRRVRLAAYRVGHQYRIDPADLARFIRECNHEEDGR